MRIARLEVENLRAISSLSLELKPSENMVLIAGPNGCGKSSIFDAIRLLKSCYGAHAPNEMQLWFNEFSINLNQPNPNLKGLFRDPTRPIRIGAEFACSEREQTYLRENAGPLSEGSFRQSFASNPLPVGPVQSIARQIRGTNATSQTLEAQFLQELNQQLQKPTCQAALSISSDGKIELQPNALLELIFQHYDPKHLGIIDYHGAHRMYGREMVGGINLQVESEDDRRKQSLLYNTNNKYSNIKSELAGAYVRDLISGTTGANSSESASLVATLVELFKTFFPEKSFQGPVPTPTGGIDFPVTTADGSSHDVNDLSSGEKELLFGYLRLRNHSPRDSVILLDEPEMHLNPRLTRGLPEFYKKHISDASNSQIWLVTHSDALLRQAVGKDGFAVFHMREPGSEVKENQLVRIEGTEIAERAVIDLVGDLATYAPDARIVIFEGEDSEFDVEMTSRLFPQLRANANLVSAGNRTSVTRLHNLLSRAKEEGKLAAKFFAIVDRDDDGHEEQGHASNIHVWPVYHIENFLLSPPHILRVLKVLEATRKIFADELEVEAALKNAARETLSELVRHRLQNQVNAKAIATLRVEADRKAPSATPSLVAALTGSKSRLIKLLEGDLSQAKLEEEEAKLVATFESALITDNWKKEFRGRDILKRFVAQLSGSKIDYKVFRDLILQRMADDKHQPDEMKTIVQAVMSG